MRSYSHYAETRSNAEKTKTRRQKLIAQGLCARCGVNIPIHGRRSCAGCLEKQRVAEKSVTGSKRARRVAEGLCVRCGLNPPVEGKQACEDCREKHRGYERKKILKRDQERKNREAVAREPVVVQPVVVQPVVAPAAMVELDRVTKAVVNFDEMYFPPGGGVKPLFRSPKEESEAIRIGVTGNEWYYSFHNKRSKTAFS